jgi:hypothetical protein
MMTEEFDELKSTLPFGAIDRNIYSQGNQRRIGQSQHMSLKAIPMDQIY